MAFYDFLFGKEGGVEQVPTMSPQQKSLYDQLIKGLQGATGSAFDFTQGILSGDTSKFEAPLMRQFEEQIIPGIAERFSSMGEGAQGSSAFQRSLGKAGAGLAEQLGALRGSLQMQALGQYSNLLNQGLGAKTFESVYRPQQQGNIGEIISILMKLVPMFL